MELKSMEYLKEKVANNDLVVRYKNNVILTVFDQNAHGTSLGGYTCQVYQPIETENETGLTFEELKLELVHTSEKSFFTEGEALAYGFNFC